MIVRISGTGQFDLDDSAAQRLEELDRHVTEAVQSGDHTKFHQCLHASIQFIEQTGKAVPHDQVVPSEVIIPPEDVSLEEAQSYFHDDKHLEGLPA